MTELDNNALYMQPLQVLREYVENIDGPHPLELRMTRQYRDGYSYNDKWRYIGNWWELSHGHDMYQGENDAGDYKVSQRIIFAVKEKVVSNGEVVQAVMDTIGGSSCTHEHDCCGCWHRVVRKAHTLLEDGGAVLMCIEVSSTQNV